MGFGTFLEWIGKECGLIFLGHQKQIPVPLQSVSVTATIIHAVAHVELTQIYVNNEKTPIEAIYCFPIKSTTGAVTHFHAELDGKIIQGVVKPNDEAKEEYEDAVSEKRTAFWGGQTKEDVFKIQVGFLRAGAEAKIVLVYTTELKNVETFSKTVLKFSIPSTVAPRYIPKETNQNSRVGAASAKTKSSSDNSVTPLSIKVVMSTQGQMTKLKCPSHRIRVVENGPSGKGQWNKAVVELKGETSTNDMNRDFVLLVTLDDSDTPRLYLERLTNSMTLMVQLVPNFRLDEVKSEVIIVLEQSLFTHGTSSSMAAVTDALNLLLKSLPVDCYFNIVRFGKFHQFLFPTSIKMDDKNLSITKIRLDQFPKDLGTGSNIFDALKKTQAMEPVSGYSRQIMVMTNGYVEETGKVFKLSRQMADQNVRIFCLGLGQNPSHHFVEGIAKAGGGTCAFLPSSCGDEMEDKVLKQLSNALTPALTDVSFQWHGVPDLGPLAAKSESVRIEKNLMGYGRPIKSQTDSDLTANRKSYRQSPGKMPPMYDGVQFLVFGIFENFGKNEPPPTGLTITAQSPEDGPISLFIELNPKVNDVGRTDLLHRMAALRSVRELEDQLLIARSDCCDEPHINFRDRKQIEEELEEKIVRIAVEHAIASKYTSFVATEASSTITDWGKKGKLETVATRIVPSNQGKESEVDVKLPEFDSYWNQTQQSQQSVLCRDNALDSLNCRSNALEMASSSFYRTAGKSRSKGFSLFRNKEEDLSMGDRTKTLKTVYTNSQSSQRSSISSVTSQIQDTVDSFKNMSTIFSTKSASAGDGLSKVAAFQLFDGSFPLSEEFVRSLGLDYKFVTGEAKKNPDWIDTDWATALAMAYFEAISSQKRVGWESVVFKTKTWLDRHVPAPMLDEMMQVIKKSVSFKF